MCHDTIYNTLSCYFLCPRKLLECEVSFHLKLEIRSTYPERVRKVKRLILLFKISTSLVMNYDIILFDE